MADFRNSLSRLAAGALLAASLCTTTAPALADAEPVWPTAQWQTSTPEDQGIDSAVLAKLLEFGSSRGLDSLLVARHGRLVLDAYYAPYTAEIPHAVNSVTKSVTSTLIAIAIKEGLIVDTSQPVLGFFPDRNPVGVDDRKKAMTLQHLLDMTSGIEWKEPLANEPPVTMIELERSTDWVRFILDRPMAATPGEVFNYNSGNSHLLSAILSKVTGKSAEAYAQEKLFGPLGITTWQWRRDPQGISTGGYALALRPRDMAKLGLLFLRRGEWDNRQLAASGWFDRISRATVDMKLPNAPDMRYSNQFWSWPSHNVYWANGFRCQLIVAYPDVDVVAVVTARDNCNRLVAYISEAVKSRQPLPQNPQASAALASLVHDIAVEKPTDRGVVSPMAAEVSGKVYEFQRNGLQMKSLALTWSGSQARYDLELYNRDPRIAAQKVSRPIGLDGLYRRSDPDGAVVDATKGKWLNSRTFEIERRSLGASNPAEKWTLWFDGDTLNLRGQDRSGRDVSIDSAPAR
jgi:CubicO group peptidase (beta-lactamase class C family)